MQVTKEPSKRPADQQPSKRELTRAQACDDDELVDPLAEASYLITHGWLKVAPQEAPNPTKRWLDPHSGKPARRVQVQQEVRDPAGRVTSQAVYHTYASVPSWYYSRREAIAIQRGRYEAAAKKKGSR